MSVYSTLSGTLAMVHPTFHCMVDISGRVFKKKKGCRLGNESYEWSYGSTDAHGYKRVQLRLRDDASIRKNVQVHRLVAECFIPNPHNKKTVDHIDRNPLHNSVYNLRWATQQEQCLNQCRYDLCIEKYGVHCCDDEKQYKKNYYSIHREEKLEYDKKRREAIKNGTWQPSRLKTSP